MASPFTRTSNRLPSRIGGPSSTPIARSNCGSDVAYRRVTVCSICFLPVRKLSAIAATAISRAFIGVDRRCSMGRLSARHAIELERRHGLTDNGDRAVAPIVARIAVLEAIDAAQAHACLLYTS